MGNIGERKENVGKKENMGPMWKSLSQYLKLDPPTEFHGGTYLGQTQEDVMIPKEVFEFIKSNTT